MATEFPPTLAVRRRRWPALLLLAILPVACMVGATLLGPQDWDASRGPVVPHDRFPADCRLCHVGDTWHEIRADFQYDHGQETGVVLRGAHARAECLRCHNDRGPVAEYAVRGCAGCHVDPHQRQLGTNCGDCHDERDWRPRQQIARHARTRFPLIGSHAAAACHRCHPGAQVGNFQRADPHCETCHADALGRARSPDHASLGWTRDCQRCHAPTAWAAARLPHTSFPLAGQHRSADCTACHVGGRFRGTARQCVDCHRGEYDRTTRPAHGSAGFSTRCESCHSAVGWTGAGFIHRWPLTGRHAALDCARCHAGNAYRGTPTACVGCHRAEYDATTDPDHRTATFPTACQLCHDTGSWRGARFNHAFPLRGEHGVACTTCHTQPANYKAFTCLVCHEHRRSKMDSEHDEVQGYSYDSAACYRCHPSGRH